MPEMRSAEVNAHAGAHGDTFIHAHPDSDPRAYGDAQPYAEPDAGAYRYAQAGNGYTNEKALAIPET